MGRTKGSKNKPKHHDGVTDPSGLRAVGKKLAADDAAKAQSKLVLDARDIAITREERELPQALAQTEVQHVAMGCARLQGEIDQLEADKAKLQKEVGELNKEIGTKHKELSKGSAEVRTGTRMILTGVRVEHDFQAAQLRFYRLDRGPAGVGELYDTTAMPPEEREKAIFTAPKDAERVVVDDTIAEGEPSEDAAPGESVAEPAVNAKGGES